MLEPGHTAYFSMLQKHLLPDVYDLAACGEDFPALEEISDFEGEFQVKLPEDFIDFSISRLGGLLVEVKEEFWPPAKEFDVRPFWAFCSGICVYGFSGDVPEWMDIRVQTTEFRQEIGQNLTACLKITGDTDCYAFTPEGNLVRWNHEAWAAEPVGKRFLEVLDDELQELAARQKRMEEERHQFEKAGE
jgi:hypothetical protein